MRNARFHSVLLAMVAISAVVTLSWRDHMHAQSVTRVDDLEIVGDTDATGVVTARAGVRLTTLTTGPILLSGAGDPNGATNATQGSLYLRTSNASLYTNTDGAMAWSAVGGGSPTAAPTAASTGFTTWWYQYATSSAADGTSGFYIRTANTAGANQWTARSKVVPSIPYTITMKISAKCPLSNTGTSAAVFVGWAEAATGAANKGMVWLWRPHTFNSGNQIAGWIDMTNATTVSLVTYTSTTQYVYGEDYWIQLVDDGGGNVSVASSPTGDTGTFITLATRTKNSSFLGAAGYNYILFGALGSSSDCVASIVSYTQT